MATGYSHTTSSKTITQWASCISTKSQSEAKKLIEQEILPSKDDLDNVCNIFSRHSEIISKVCSLIDTKIRKQSEGVLDVIPSYQHDELDSRVSIVFVVIIKKGQLFSKFKDYAYYVKFEGEFNDEGKRVALERMKATECPISSLENDLKDISDCIKRNTNFLFDKHSNLNGILPSLGKSTGYTLHKSAFRWPTGKTELKPSGITECNSSKHKITVEPCIALYVTAKGYIPLKEEELPKDIDRFKIDVLEGEFGRYDGGPNEYHDNLKMGLAISANSLSNTTGHGTLGGFIDIDSHGLCAITCAHVLFNGTELGDIMNTESFRNIDLDKRRTVCQPTIKAFGDVVCAVVQQGSSDKPSIDVAVIRIQTRRPIDGSFPRTSTHDSAESERNNNLCYNSGNVCDVSELKFGTEVYKVGMKTECTRGTYFSSRGAVKITLGDTFKFKLVNQIVIYPKDCEKFADKGDSGSLVLIKDNQDSTAIGIVEGGHSDSYPVFVTPIIDILDEVLSSRKMHQFSIAADREI